MSILQHLFSPVCLHCGSFFVEDSLLCAPCFQRRLRARLWVRKPTHVSGHHYLLKWNPYESDLLSELIYRLKGRRGAAAWRFYGERLYLAVEDKIQWSSYQALIPLAGSKPSSVHAHLLAHRLSELSGLPVWDLLQKQVMQKNNEQKKLSAQERQRFTRVTLKSQPPEDFTKLIFVDDVLTTGQSYQQSREAVRGRLLPLTDITLNSTEAPKDLLQDVPQDVILTLFYRPKAQVGAT